MRTLFFAIFYGLVYLFSCLPLWLLYRLSDLLYLLNYYVIRYRMGVVRENLKNSFPEKSEAERTLICRAFYHYLSDQLVESIKTLSISAKSLDKRVQFENPEVMNALYDRGISVVHLLGHHANWEWYAKQLARKTKHQLFFVYKPLSNKIMDQLMYRLRARFGVMPVAMRAIFKTIQAFDHQPHASFFGGDQSPMQHNKYLWLNFMHQETAVYLGAEDIARQYKQAVVFGKMRRLKRGYYSISLELITDQPNELPYGEITRKHTLALESLLAEQPAYWLWSHRRWKLKRTA